MIESLVNAFTKNSFIFSRKTDQGGADFQNALAQHDQQQVHNQNQNDKSFDNTFEYAKDEQYRRDDYNHDDETSFKEEQYEKESETVQDEQKMEVVESVADVEEDSVEKTEEDQPSTESKELDILKLLKELGLSEEDLKTIQEIIANPEKMPGDEVLNKVLASLKKAMSGEVPAEALKKLESFSDKFQQLLKEGHKHLSKDLKQMLTQNPKAEKPVIKEDLGSFKGQLENQDKVDQQIKQNNSKFAAMKEVAQDAKNVKFNSEIDPRFAQDTKKSNQAFQARQAQFNAMAAGNTAKQQANTGQQQGGGEASLKSPNFIKKMKSILNSNSQNSQSADFNLNQQAKLQANNAKPAFMNRVNSGQFMQQLVDKIQNMVKANTTLSAKVDFSSAEFGDMKLAAEAQGTSLAVKLSNIASNMKADVVNLKAELDAELKNLGFENVELDFGSESDRGSNSNVFEDEMQKRLSGEHVKLPGDHLADLKAIDEWMKGFQKVM